MFECFGCFTNHRFEMLVVDCFYGEVSEVI
jgi:hypothetical protein